MPSVWELEAMGLNECATHRLDWAHSYSGTPELVMDKAASFELNTSPGLTHVVPGKLFELQKLLGAQGGKLTFGIKGNRAGNVVARMEQLKVTLPLC